MERSCLREFETKPNWSNIARLLLKYKPFFIVPSTRNRENKRPVIVRDLTTLSLF